MSATLTFPCNGNPYSGPAIPIRSADELRKALRAARERAVSVDLSGLTRMLRLDGPRRLIELQASAAWSALQDHGVSEVLPGTIGDAVSANAPAPDGTPMVAHVEAITLVTADGEVRRADRHANTDLFELAVGGHGLFGVLYSVTLRLDSLLRSQQRAEVPVVLEIAEIIEAAAVRTVEFLVPPERLDSILACFKRIVAERRIGLQRITVHKLRSECETFLRWATREWAQVTVRYSARQTLGACAHAAEIERLLLDFVLSAGGSFRIGASPQASLAHLQRCYPQLADFLAQKKRLDPAERLHNAWYRRIAVQPRAA
jgi:FAD/FMN-containing dehydrogenase